METIILKTIICSGILLGFYYLFLAKERTFVFNRFFLIFCLVFSYTVPFIIIPTQQKAHVEKIIFGDEKTLQTVSYSPISGSEQSFDYISLLLTVYLLISGILLCKLFCFQCIKSKVLKETKLSIETEQLKSLKTICLL
jgi:hypothetical protein